MWFEHMVWGSSLIMSKREAENERECRGGAALSHTREVEQRGPGVGMHALCAHPLERVLRTHRPLSPRATPLGPLGARAGAHHALRHAHRAQATANPVFSILTIVYTWRTSHTHMFDAACIA